MSLPFTTIDQLFKDRVARNGSLPYFHFEDYTCSFSECDALIEHTASALCDTADVDGRFVGLISSNRPEFVIAYLAILRAGAKVVPINPRLGREELAYIIRDACIPAVVHPSCMSIQVDGTAAPLICEDCIDLSMVTVSPGLLGDIPFFPEKIDDIAVCIYTSGTTGRAKGALLTHLALMHNARMCADGLGSKDGEECFVTVLPLFHAFAASACMLHAIWCSSRMLLIEQFNPREIFNQMAQHAATVFMGVPAMYGVMAQADTVPDIPGWWLNVSGGAPLPQVISDRFQAKFNMPIHEGDGPTECGPATSINPVHGKVKVGTIGLPLIDVEMKIVDDAGTELARNEIGEIIVRCPSNFTGYLNQPEETAKTLIDGWVHTGDLGTCDDDGYFSIVDRKKDMLIVGGLNVYPREVEEHLLHHPAIAQCAIVGKDDGIRGEIPVAFVVLNENAELSLPEMKSFLRDRIANYKIPRELRCKKELPRNATGKVLKTVLRQQL
jgi:long-chain acyl-CoA synthetase